MTPRSEGSPAIAARDVAPLLGRLVRVRMSTRDGRGERAALTGWLVTVRRDRLELVLPVEARCWVRLGRVLAVERVTLDTPAKQDGAGRGLDQASGPGSPDPLTERQRQQRKSRTVNHNQATRSREVNYSASRGETAGEGQLMQQHEKPKLTPHDLQCLAELRQAWKDYNGDLIGRAHVRLPVPTIEAFGREFTTACDAGDLHGAQEVFQRYVNASEGRA